MTLLSSMGGHKARRSLLRPSIWRVVFARYSLLILTLVFLLGSFLCLEAVDALDLATLAVSAWPCAVALELEPPAVGAHLRAGPSPSPLLLPLFQLRLSWRAAAATAAAGDAATAARLHHGHAHHRVSASIYSLDACD